MTGIAHDIPLSQYIGRACFNPRHLVWEALDLNSPEALPAVVQLQILPREMLGVEACARLL